MNTIRWQPKALRQLRKLEAQDSARIRAAVSEELIDLDKAKNVKALSSHEYGYGYRQRVRNFRVLFEFDGDVRIVQVEEVRKRIERTY